MLKEVARNAHIAATKFTENAGAKVSRIRHPRQEALLIIEVGQNHGDTRNLEKTSEWSPQSSSPSLIKW